MAEKPLTAVLAIELCRNSKRKKEADFIIYQIAFPVQDGLRPPMGGWFQSRTLRFAFLLIYSNFEK